MSDDEEYAAAPAYGGPPIPGIGGTNPPSPDPEVTFMLMSVPKPLTVEEMEAGVRKRPYIPAIKELRAQFNLQLKPALNFVRSTPCAITVDRQSVLEPKAEAMRIWGCEIALVAPA